MRGRITIVNPSNAASWLALATVVATIATVGSLWFSLGRGLVPCELCWYQRILMYPLVVILGVATIEHRRTVWRTVLPLSIPGIAIAAYHSVLQVTATTCTLTGPCGTIQWRLPLLGLTIPNLSLLAFCLITGSVVVQAGVFDRDRSP